MQILKVPVIGSLITALVGFLDAAYLTIERFHQAIPPCSIGGCETVLTSRYSQILGIPVSLLGAIYYVVLIMLLVAFLTNGYRPLIRMFGYFVILGFIASIWFVFAQVALLHAICFYCLTSEALCTILFVFGLHLLPNSTH